MFDKIFLQATDWIYSLFVLAEFYDDEERRENVLSELSQVIHWKQPMYVFLVDKFLFFLLFILFYDCQIF